MTLPVDAWWLCTKPGMLAVAILTEAVSVRLPGA